jgi:hypothetical protein
MKTAVVDIMVFPRTGFTHREILHGSPVPVVRQRLYNGEAGTTSCTVNKRILKPVRLGFHIPDALIAYRNVGTDLRDAIHLILTVNDPEISISIHRHFSKINGFYS